MKKVENPNKVIISQLAGDHVHVINRNTLVKIKWKKITQNEDMIITLSDISNQYPRSSLLVIVETPLMGTIYRYGNYDNKNWYEVGTTCGYA